MTSAADATLRICGSYTVDPVADAIDHWHECFGRGAPTEVAEYGQLHRELLQPSSAFRQKRSGVHVVLLRWEDLLGRALHDARESSAALERVLQTGVDDMVATLLAVEHRIPCLVLIGPSRPEHPALARATATLCQALAGAANLFVQTGETAMAKYRVERVHDDASDRFGHVPFTPEALAALGTVAARWHLALTRPPIKVLAVDADHTLWSGVVAEDGVDGVELSNEHRLWQQALQRQITKGRLLALLSKNEERDVQNLFERRPEMTLKWPDFAARRIDWRPKADNIGDVAAELGLGLDTFAFLDDNPIECGDMRARRPEVTTVRVPSERAALPSFAEHLWLLDQPRVTDEDRRRSSMYSEAASRAASQRAAPSFGDFIARLELVVEFDAVRAADVPRMAQLSQRTNQFNASLQRCDDAAILAGLGDPGVWHRLVRVRDRFGDYGIVGQMRARAHGDALRADLFMLSCRALGRGVEHRMLAALGAQAMTLGLPKVKILMQRGERNGPARHFLSAVFATAADEARASEEAASQWLELPALMVSAVAFDPAEGPSMTAEHQSQTGSLPGEAVSRTASHGELYERIAHTLTTGADIVRAMAARVKERPELSSAFVAPAEGLQRDLASIWQEVLRIRSVGAQDRFQDLGGRSIHLVQVHRLILERLGIDVAITALFEHASVASLARHLSQPASNNGSEAVRVRARQMRAAKLRSAARYGAAS